MDNIILNCKPAEPLASFELADETAKVYDPSGNMSWDNIVFRPKAPFTDAFGYIPRRKTGAKIHTGTDRGLGDGYVYAPFACLACMVEYGDGPGTILRMFPIVRDNSKNYWLGFFIDVYHCVPGLCGSKQSGELPDLGAFSAGEQIAIVGAEGLSTGLHTHTEVCVPQEKTPFDIAHRFIFARNTNNWGKDFSAKNLADRRNNILTREALVGNLGPTVTKQMTDWRIEIVDKYNILRTLPPRRSGEKVWLFDSNTLFDM